MFDSGVNCCEEVFSQDLKKSVKMYASTSVDSIICAYSSLNANTLSHCRDEPDLCVASTAVDYSVSALPGVMTPSFE